jgi:hypothetical protein
MGCIPTKTWWPARAGWWRAPPSGCHAKGGVRRHGGGEGAQDTVVGGSRQSLDRWIGGTQNLTLIDPRDSSARTRSRSTDDG